MAKVKMQPKKVRDDLLSLLYVLRHTEEQALIACWHTVSEQDLIFPPWGKASSLPHRKAQALYSPKPVTSYEPEKWCGSF